ncbi:MAG: hypothetical protein IJK40_06835 [Clostridia bacterium]|nr:hypothetical protein [Clostridia bacterium]MBR0537848.1 hypothetical protein [Clostridia bacterium]
MLRYYGGAIRLDIGNITTETVYANNTYIGTLYKGNYAPTLHLNGCTFSGDWDNCNYLLFPSEWTAEETEKLGDSFSVIVRAEAIQSAGFEDGVNPDTGEFVSAIDRAWDVYNTYVYIEPGE